MSQTTYKSRPPQHPEPSAESKIGDPKFKIDSCTELVWPDKYKEDGSVKEVPCVSLPFQVIETVNESRSTRETEKYEGTTLLDLYQGKEGENQKEKHLWAWD